MRLKYLAATALLASASPAIAQTLDWQEIASPSRQSINSVAFTPSGAHVISGTNCHPASIRIFQTSDGNLEWDYTLGNDLMCVMGVTFSSNSSYIAAIEEFGNLLIFDNTGTSPTPIDTLNTNTSYAFATAISPDNTAVAVACSNGKLKIYSLPSGTLLHDINAHTSWASTVAYSPDGNYIATGGNDDKVKVWNSDGSLLFAGTSHTADITSVKFTPDNQSLVSAAKDDKIKIWDISTYNLINTIDGHSQDVTAVDISPDGSKIVSASIDSTAKIWQIQSGDLLATMNHDYALNAVAWSPAGNKIATGDSQSNLTMWTIPTVLAITTAQIHSIKAFPNPCGSILYTNTTPLQMTIYDIVGQQVLSCIEQSQIDVSSLSSGQYILHIRTSSELFTQKIVIHR